MSSEGEDEASTLPAGYELDKYKILDKLGQGGMGAVYRAEHTKVHREVAVKVLLRKFGGSSIAERFKQEWFLPNKIKSEHVVKTIDAGEINGLLYVVMDLLEGMSLEATIRMGRLPPRRVVNIGRQSCAGLQAAHAVGIAHRDIKPANIFLSGEMDFVKLLDFGVAKILEPIRGAKMTIAGRGLYGTPEYVAPEQIRGFGETRSDLYSLGITLFEMLTGRVPFRLIDVDNDYDRLFEQHQTKAPPDLRQLAPDTPGTLVAIVNRCMAKNKDHRFQSMTELGEALARVYDTSSPAPVARAPLPPEAPRTLPGTPVASAHLPPPPAPARGRVPALEPPPVAAPSAPREVRDREQSAPNAMASMEPTAPMAAPPPSPRTAVLPTGRDPNAPVEPQSLSAPKPNSGSLSMAKGEVSAKTPVAKRSSKAGVLAIAGLGTLLAAGGGLYVAARYGVLGGPKPPAVTVGQPVQPVSPKETPSDPVAKEPPPQAGNKGAAPPEVAQAAPIPAAKEGPSLPAAKQELPTQLPSGIGEPPKPNGVVAKAAEAHPRATAKSGSLWVLVLPFAEVFVDGKRIGSTPVRNYSIKPGTHVVEMVHEGLGKRETRTVKIEPGHSERIQIDWEH